MVLTMSVVFGWTFGVRWLYKKQGWMMPEERQKQEQQAAATQPVGASPGATTQTSSTSPTTGPAGAPATGPAGAGGLRLASSSAPAQSVALGSDAFKDKTYAL